MAVAAGAVAVSASSVLIELADCAPGTASFFRCLLALPLLALLAAGERRERRALSRRELGVAALAGVLFAADTLLWTQAIFDVGAGVSTVLVNVQVVIVPLLALTIDREPVTARFLATLPFAGIGVVLAGGLLEEGVTGAHTVRGTVDAVLAAVAYSGFLFVLRRSGRTAPVVQSYGAVMTTAVLGSLVGGVLWAGFDPTPAAAALGWLALSGVCGQVVGWLLVAHGSPRLDSQTSSVLLLLTPIGSLLLGALILAERPSALQLGGSAIILLCAYFVATRRRVTAAARR